MPVEYVIDPARRPALSVAGSDALFPVHRIYCVGRNYAAHAREMGQQERELPFFFSKPADAVTQSAEVAWPPATSNLHHEVELVVALGSGGRNLDAASALQHVYGYAVGVDLTRRDLQALAKEKRRPWDASKGFDESAPVSRISPAAKWEELSEAEIYLLVDGKLRQRASLAEMIWPVPEIIAELSRYFTLAPGDLVFTGTPQGVSALSPGARVECGIRGLTSHMFTMGTPGKS
jgi:fumarylpyruvate hydrolase